MYITTFCQLEMLHKKLINPESYLPFSKKLITSSVNRYSRGFLHSISSINSLNSPLYFDFDFFDYDYLRNSNPELYLIWAWLTFDFFESDFLCSHSLQYQLSLRLSRSSVSIGGSTQVKWKAFGQASQHKNWPAPPQASQRSWFF